MKNESEKIRKGYGNQFKEARELAHMTQLQVAEASGMNVNYYAQIERGEINTSIEKLHSIAKVLNIKSLDIL